MADKRYLRVAGVFQNAVNFFRNGAQHFDVHGHGWFLRQLYRVAAVHLIPKRVTKLFSKAVPLQGEAAGAVDKQQRRQLAWLVTFVVICSKHEIHCPPIKPYRRIENDANQKIQHGPGLDISLLEWNKNVFSDFY